MKNKKLNQAGSISKPKMECARAAANDSRQSILAANAGLGVHERWNNNTDRVYQTIDYVEIEGTDLEDPDPGPSKGMPWLPLLLGND